MGEQELLISASSPMNIVIMRNTRGKLFVYVAVLGVLCFIVFLLSNTHTNLKELEGVNERCQQQRDSFSAQLQVLYEHKNRLEKSLQQEKTDHKHTREANEKQASELENKFQKEKDDRQKLENQVSQLKTSFSELEEEKAQSESSLKQQLKVIQGQKDSEIEKLQNHITDLLTEKDKLETSINEISYKLEQHSNDINLCHVQLQQSKGDLHSCQEQVRLHSSNIPQPSPLGAAVQKAAIEENNIIQQDKPELHEKQENSIISPKTEKTEQLSQNTIDTNPNKSASTNMLLKKPHIMPANLGVLPKPVELQPVSPNKDLNGAAVPNKVDHIGERDLEAKSHLGLEDVKAVEVQQPAVQNLDVKEQENRPQVVAPNFENLEEKDDHGGERGEEGNQYGGLDIKPVFDTMNAPAKPMYPVNQQSNNIDVAAAQMNDMMNKSPGEVVNNAVEQNVLGVPPHLGFNENKMDQDHAFMHRGADRNNDKNYEEDDDDREDDEMPNRGPGVNIKGINANAHVQDNDFDDQDNNLDKEEEGVMAAPK